MHRREICSSCRVLDLRRTPKMISTKTEVLIPERLVAEQRYRVSTRTLRRWDITPGLNFPAPIYIKKRRYRRVDQLDAWDKQNSKRAAGLLAATKPTTPDQPTP